MGKILSGKIQITFILLAILLYAAGSSPLFAAGMDPNYTTEKNELNNKAISALRMGERIEAARLYGELAALAVKNGDAITAVMSYKSQGGAYSALGNFEESKKVYTEAIEYAQKKMPLQLPDLYAALGETYYRYGYLKEALEEYNRAVKSGGKNLNDVTRNRILVLQAITYREMGDDDTYKKITGKVRKNILAEMAKREKEKNFFLRYIAGWKMIGLYQQLGDFETALKEADKLLDYCKKHNLTMNIPMMYSTKASIYTVMGKYSEAIELFRKAEAESKKLGINNPNQTYGIQIANTLFRLERYEEAAREIRTMIDSQEKMKNKNPESIAWLYFYLGRNYLNLGLYDKARESINKMMSMAGGERSENSYVYGLYYLALIHYEKGEIDRAIESLNKGIAFCKRSGSYLSYQFYELRARIHEYDDEYKEGIESYKEALKTIPSQLHYQKAIIYLDLGELQKKAGDKNADESLKSAVTEADRVKTLRYTNMLVLLHVTRGRANYLLGNRSKALEDYRAAGKVLETVDEPGYKWRVWYRIGQVFEKENRVEEAVNAYKSGIKVIESQRGSIKIPELKTSYSGIRSRFSKVSVNEIYERLVHLLTKSGNEKEAFSYAERARSRALLDVVGGINPGKKGGSSIPGKLLGLQKKINEITLSIRAQSSDLRGSSKDLLRESRTRLASLKQQYNKELLDLKIKNREMYDLKTVDPPSLAKIESSLDKKTAIVEYSIGENETVIFVIRKGSVKALTIPLSKSKIDRSVYLLRKKLKTPDPDSMKDIEALSEELSASIIKPVLPELKGIRNIIFVPSGSLHFIPFAILRDDRGRILIENYVVGYSPSASVLVFTGNKKSKSGKKLTAFALGNPYGKKEGPWTGLPGTVKEVKAIGELFENKKIIEGGSLNKAAVISTASQGDVVHFATHGILDSRNPQFSGLALYDSLLTMNDIFFLDLKAGLVVLSACETGLGKLSGGEEIIGLSRAFQFAGAPSLIVTLWSVSDVSTMELMKEFYGELQSVSAGEALRKAQLEVRRKHPHPFHWAAFILIGNIK